MLKILIATLALQAQPDPAKSDLALSAALDKAEYVIGEEMQAEVTLANASDKDLEVAEFTFEERSLGFDVTFEAAPSKPKLFTYAITRPDPHLVERLPLARVSLKARKSVTGLFRIPTLKPGEVTVVARYAGGDKELRSAPVKVKVKEQADGASKLAAILETAQGNMTIQLLPEEAPNSVANFVNLARREFYNNLLFFRVVKNQWIQSGCPYDQGFGHPGHSIRSEASGQTAVHDAGTVAMSENMKQSFVGSQFFIGLTRIPSHDKKFPVIGRLDAAGLDVARKIAAVEVDKNTDRPKEDVRLTKVTIVVVK